MDESTRRPKILIVDDDQFTLSLVSSIIDKNGYDAIQAKDAEDALNIVFLEDPDMAMLDVNLPGMSGLELAQRLRESSDVPFMFLSGVSDEAAVKRAVEYGASGYLVKPVDVQNLMPTLESCLARAAEMKALRARESKLTSALAAGRETSIAVGILMERFRVGRERAFATLRAQARSNRIGINEVAGAIVQSAESLNQFQLALDATAVNTRTDSPPQAPRGRLRD